MPVCSRCGVEHDRWRDREHAFPQSYCAACHAAHMRTTRPRHSELPPEQRRRANLRRHTNVLIERGQLERQPCEVCGGTAEARHLDWDDPRAIRWICRACG